MEISCPYCNGIKITKQIDCKDYFLSQEKFDIQYCPDCGVLFTTPIPSPDSIGKYYKSEQYFSHSNSKKSITGLLYGIARKYALSGKKRLINRLVAGVAERKILDIGCGTGHFLHSMQQGGWTTRGYEINTDAVRFACDHFKLDVRPATTLLQETDRFDVITMWHVLEHIHHPDEYLSVFEHVLTDTGVLVIALPNPESYDCKYYGKYWGGYDVPRHLWHFSPTFVKAIFEKHGFVIEQIKPMPLDAFYVSMLSEQYKNHNLPLLRGAWTGVKGLLAGIKRGKETSSSLIYILKRKK